MKAGRTYSQYGCSAHHHEGANGLTIGEARLLEAVFTEVRAYFASPEYEAWLEGWYTANERARARAARESDDVAGAQARVEKVTEALAQIGYSEPLAAKLRTEEARLPGRPPVARDRRCGGDTGARLARLLRSRRPGRRQAPRHRRHRDAPEGEGPATLSFSRWR